MTKDLLENVNQRINRAIRYLSDQADRWQTPIETLERGEGDCEDFAILKMNELLNAGWPADDLRLVYCRFTGGRVVQAHMVLEAHENGAVWVLDNMGDRVFGWPARPDLRPVFSFNARRFWVRGQVTDVDPRQRMGQWRRMLERAARQGTHFTGGAHA